jgi:ABC-2 type transport system ATP-binding protein
METIHLKNVDFRYRKRVPLLSDINLKIQPGHIHGLIGKNGEGKSALLKLIAGLLFAREGSVDVLGFDPRRRSPEFLREVYFLSEEAPNFTLNISDFERVYAPFYPNFSQNAFDSNLIAFDIHSRNRKISRLSHGGRKKVMIAFALAARTKILLMDEPTNGLDIPSKGRFRRMVASALDDDRCILLATHQVRDLENLIDNIIIMDKHQIVLNESVDTITDRLIFRLPGHNKRHGNVLYSEDTFRGIFQVCENARHDDSNLDIELLFKAIQANKQPIQQLFNPTNDSSHENLSI